MRVNEIKDVTCFLNTLSLFIYSGPLAFLITTFTYLRVTFRTIWHERCRHWLVLFSQDHLSFPYYYITAKPGGCVVTSAVTTALSNYYSNQPRPLLRSVRDSTTCLDWQWLILYFSLWTNNASVYCGVLLWPRCFIDFFLSQIIYVCYRQRDSLLSIMMPIMNVHLNLLMLGE